MVKFLLLIQNGFDFIFKRQAMLNGEKAAIEVTITTSWFCKFNIKGCSFKKRIILLV